MMPLEAIITRRCRSRRGILFLVGTEVLQGVVAYWLKVCLRAYLDWRQTCYDVPTCESRVAPSLLQMYLYIYLDEPRACGDVNMYTKISAEPPNPNKTELALT